MLAAPSLSWLNRPNEDCDPDEGSCDDEDCASWSSKYRCRAVAFWDGPKSTCNRMKDSRRHKNIARCPYNKYTNKERGVEKEQFRHHIPARTGSEVEAEDVDGATSEDTGCLGLTFLVSEISCSRSRMSTMFGRSSGCIFNIKPSTNSEHLKPSTHWWQSWIQCSRLLKVNHVA